MKMGLNNEFIHFQSQDKPIANVNFASRVHLFVSQSATFALENMHSAMADEGEMPRTDLAILSIYKLANSTALCIRWK